MVFQPSTYVFFGGCYCFTSIPRISQVFFPTFPVHPRSTEVKFPILPSDIQLVGYPLIIEQFAIENGHLYILYIVDLPINMVIFHDFLPNWEFTRE